ncbi:sensor histidine kinase [Virgisporangium aurantiacum]|uniref:histidine kinase n=1 Tax=Virgisporangium aurantiacum TaxID=175570 RepID=A0A8J4DXC8_9ACTN|nr:sensor histidine kinase [Virgisporangium aurantiacum]GIJ54415.1 two-component sensor histidine kinase [Virgisporangium aurantiacum]
MRRSALAWTGFAVSPLLFIAWLLGVSPEAAIFGLWYVVPAAFLVLLVGALRRKPFAVLALLVVMLVLVEFGAPEWENAAPAIGMRVILVVAVDVAVGWIAATHERLASVGTAVAVAVFQVALSFAGPWTEGDQISALVPYLVALLAAWLVGNTVRQRRLFAEVRLVEAANTAAQTERLRIARELHDLVAHSIGVIAMQAGMGRRVIDSQPEEARRALGVIEDTGRETLSSLRRMVGGLRQADPDGAPSPRDPAPGLADLAALAERFGAAGVRVEVRDTGDRRPLPPDVDVSAYRIIQEAVTNVARHAGTDHCRVAVDRTPGALDIEVLDDGRGGDVGPGFGIVGMRERVALLGGEFSAGPRPEGGFRVAARLPLDS